MTTAKVAGYGRSDRPGSGLRDAPRDVAAELRDWIGPGAAARVAALPHDADAPAAFLGTDPSGIRSRRTRRWRAPARCWRSGRIVFHYLAGFGGGRKMLGPGGRRAGDDPGGAPRCLSTRPGAGRHPLARAGYSKETRSTRRRSRLARLFPR